MCEERGVRDEEGEERKVVEVAATVFLGYGVGLWRGVELVEGAGEVGRSAGQRTSM